MVWSQAMTSRGVSDMREEDASTSRQARLFWAAWFLAFGTLSALWPRDAGFDVMHYHLHNGWSALHGRLHHDLAPAEMHSFLNPVWNIVVWWLIEHLPGPVVAFLLGLVQGALLPALYGLTRRLSRVLGAPLGWRVALFIAALGCITAPAWSSFASIRNDHLGALAFIMGLWLVLPREARGQVSIKSLALGALLVGGAAGLKLTNVIYVPAFAVFVLILAPGWSTRLRNGLVAAGAGLVAFLVLAGPWMWVLWQEFANPVYPMFAGLFSGPEAPLEATRDTRYLPGSTSQAIWRPVLASWNGLLINETPVRDLRLGLGYLAAFGIVGRARQFWRGADEAPQRAGLALGVSLLVLIFVWLSLFAIMRYALAAWLLAPLMGWVLLPSLGIQWPAGRKGYALAGLTAALLIFTISPERTRRIPWTSPTEPYITVERPDMFDYDGALILIASEFPAAFTATAFPEARITHIDPQDWSEPFLARYRPRIDAAIEAQTGPLYLIHCWPKRIGEDDASAIFDAYTAEMALDSIRSRHDLAIAKPGCQPLPTSFSTEYTSWQICPLTQESDRP